MYSTGIDTRFLILHSLKPKKLCKKTFTLVCFLLFLSGQNLLLVLLLFDGALLGLVAVVLARFLSNLSKVLLKLSVLFPMKRDIEIQTHKVVSIFAHYKQDNSSIFHLPEIISTISLGLLLHIIGTLV